MTFERIQIEITAGIMKAAINEREAYQCQRSINQREENTPAHLHTRPRIRFIYVPAHTRDTMP